MSFLTNEAREKSGLKIRGILRTEKAKKEANNEQIRA